MKCKQCFFLATATDKNFCYFYFKEVTEICDDFLQKECKLCINGINKKKCLIGNKNYPNLCNEFRRFKNWASKLK